MPKASGGCLSAAQTLSTADALRVVKHHLADVQENEYADGKSRLAHLSRNFFEVAIAGA